MIVMEETGNRHYYLQDELGSTIKDIKRKEYAIDINDYDVTTRTDLIEFIKYGGKWKRCLFYRI